MKWSETLQYRSDIVMWTIADALVPVIALAVWYTVATSNTSAHGFTPRDTLTYYILVIFTRIITGAWSGYFLSGEILKGELVRYLVRPLAVVWVHIAENISTKLLRLFIPLPIFLFALWQWPQFFSPALYDVSHLAPFLLSTAIAAVLVFCVDLAFGMLAFWLEDAMQLREYEALLYEIASGTLIPLAFLPPLAQSVFSWLPFPSMLNTPVSILLGQVVGIAMWKLIAVQIAWVAITIILLLVLWRRGLKVYAVPGQ